MSQVLNLKKVIYNKFINVNPQGHIDKLFHHHRATPSTRTRSNYNEENSVVLYIVTRWEEIFKTILLLKIVPSVSKNKWYVYKYRIM